MTHCRLLHYLWLPKHFLESISGRTGDPYCPLLMFTPTACSSSHPGPNSCIAMEGVVCHAVTLLPSTPQACLASLLFSHTDAGSQFLDHPLLFSYVTSRELDGNCNTRNTNRHPFGIPVLEEGGLARWAVTLGPFALFFSSLQNTSLVIFFWISFFDLPFPSLLKSIM